MTDTAKHKPLVFSGMQPTNTLHLGNYLGALRNWVKLQASMPCIYCVVDMHAITVETDQGAGAGDARSHRRLYRRRRRSQALDHVQPVAGRGHAELAWVFNCVARIGWLDRMTQFKDKAGKHGENASVGLFVYPVLMAADILVYRATHVPVGEDQKQHLELARDIAQKFNNDFRRAGFLSAARAVHRRARARASCRCATARRRCRSPTSPTIRAST